MKHDPFACHKWGGLNKRYQQFPHGTRRLLDPVTGGAVAFGIDLHYENWIIHRFDQDVVKLDASPAPIEVAAEEGAVLKAVAHLDLVRKSGRRELHLVCKSTEKAAGQARLARVARALDAELVIRPRALIRQDLVLITNLRQVRQTMTKWLGHGLELDELILGRVAQKKLTSRASLVHAFNHCAPDLVDARLGHLHCEGRLSIQLSKVKYGDPTIIASI